MAKRRRDTIEMIADCVKHQSNESAGTMLSWALWTQVAGRGYETLTGFNREGVVPEVRVEVANG